MIFIFKSVGVGVEGYRLGSEILSEQYIKSKISKKKNKNQLFDKAHNESTLNYAESEKFVCNGQKNRISMIRHGRILITSCRPSGVSSYTMMV